jgi:autotransporter-associated beta strand protein
LGLLLSGPLSVADEYWDGTTTIGSDVAGGKGGGGTWDNSTTNWVNASGSNPTSYVPTETAHFGNYGGVVTIGENISFTALEFDANSYFIEPSGNLTLTPVGAAKITALSGDNATIDAPVVGTGSLTIGGAGSVTLRNANTYTGGTTLTNGGTLFVDSNTALGTGPLVITGAGTTLGTHVDSTTLSIPISVQTSSFTIETKSTAVNFILNGTVNLNGSTRTIIGATRSEQVQFGTGGIGVAGDPAGLNLNTTFTGQGDYVAFIFQAGNVNHYTGLTTVNNGAFLVFEGSTADSGIHGNVDIEGNGVVDYLGGASSQIVSTATVTDNSKGNTANGIIFEGLDLYNSTGETIKALNGNGTVGLAAATLTVSSGNFSGQISNGRHAGISGGGLTMAGSGALTLSGTNTYTGATTIQSGAIDAGAANTLSPNSSITIDGGATLNLNGNNQTVGSIQSTAGNATINLGSATLTTGNDNSSQTFAGVINGSGGLTKIGTGGLTLTGGNGYTGATTLNGGTLTVAASTTTPTVLSSSSALAVGGGTFQYQGATSGTSNQTLNGLTVNQGWTEISVNQNGGTGTTLNLGGITRNAGGISDFTVSGAASAITTTQANDATGILGAWATVNGGAALATNSGGNIVAYTGYTSVMSSGNAIPTTPTANVTTDGVATVTLAGGAGTTSINTLTQNSGSTVVSMGGGTLQVGAGTTSGVGGIYITPGAGSLQIGQTGSAGTLTAGGPTANSPGELLLANYSSSAGSTLTINSTITNNGSGTVGVTVAGTNTAGAGVTLLNAANSYTGATLVVSGTLETGVAGAISTASAVTVQGGTLNLNGISQSLASLSDGGSTTGTVQLNGAQLTLGAGNADSTFSGTIADGATTGGSIVQAGTGTLTLSNPNNSYSGGTTLNSGKLIANGSATDGSGTPLGTGTLTINGGTLGTTVEPATGVTGTNLTNAITVNNSFNVQPNTDAKNPLLQNLTLSGAVTLAAGSPTITGTTAGGHVFFSGVVGDGAGNAGGGITFSASSAVQGNASTPYAIFVYNGSAANTYTGLTQVTQGAVLMLNDSAGTAVAGDLAVGTGGVVGFQQSSQTASTTNVTVNSTGMTIGGVSYAGLELAGTNQTVASITGSGTIALGGGTLTVNSSSVFNGVIEDGHFGTGGGLTFDPASSAAELQLGGVNTYTGATKVLGGTLQTTVAGALPTMSAVEVDSANSATLDLNDFNQSIGSLANGPNGGGTVSLGTATLTTGNDNTSTEFGGTITGTGGITKVGAGLFDITGTGNTYTGPTTVNAGTLEVDGTITSAVTVNKGGTFVLGTAGRVNSGSGTTPVTLNTGATFDNNGNLTVTGAGSVGVAAPGGGVMINNNQGAVISGVKGIVVTNPTGTDVEVLNDGTITGTGGIAIDASGSGGFILYNFGTINGQVLFGTGPSTVVLATGISPTPTKGGGANSTLELAGGGEGEVNLSNFPNFGSLNKVGGGLWTLDGTGVFPVGTTVRNGTINLQGTLASNVTIQPLGMMTGVGTVFGTILNLGTVQPGLPIGVINPTTFPGTLHVQGNYEQGDQGQLIIDVGGTKPGEYSSLQIFGHAALGGTLVLQQTNRGANLTIGQTLPIISASGGISGGFLNIVNPLTSDTVVLPKVAYAPNAVVLEGEQGSFEAIQQRGVPLTSNETAVAGALDRIIADGNHQDGSAKKLIGYLDARHIEQLPSDFDKIAPSQVGSVYRLGVSLADVQAGTLQQRTSDLRDGVTGFNAAGFQTTGTQNYAGGLTGPNGVDGKTAKPAPADPNWGAFVTGSGDFIHVGDSDNARGYNLATGGVTIGADYRLGENLAVGVTAGYNGTDSKLADNGRLQVNGGKLGVYGTYYQNGFYGDVIAGGGYNNYEVRRGALQGEAHGTTGGGEGDVLVAAGYDWRMEGLSIGPTASLEYTYLGLGSYNEIGSLAPLRYPTQHDDSLRSTIGLKALYDFKWGNMVIRPQAQIAWLHEYGNRNATIDASLQSGPGDLFSVSDSNISRDSLQFSGGVSLLFNPHTSTYLFYDADLLRKEYYSQSVTGGLRLSF